MPTQLKFDKPAKVDLGKIDPDDTAKMTKEDCEAEMTKLQEEFAELQEWMYAARRHSLLVVLQGMDTSGKDGTIAHVMQAVNPQGCAVSSFKVPTEEELSHDFLWRIHKQAPAKGMITIFNRSHYEDVLVTRVHKIIDKDTCVDRYDQIRSFEALLTSNSTIVLKFFLHISKGEQERRLLERERQPEKAWKLNPGDWAERKLWKNYTEAYEDAIGATAAKDAPWFIVPANHKWSRNLIIARQIVESLRPYKKDWTKDLKKLGEAQKSALAKMREAERSGKFQNDKDN